MMHNTQTNSRFPWQLFFLSTGLLSAACNLQEFDDLADSTWVHAGSKPGDLESTGFGGGLVPSGGDELNYVVTSSAPPAVVAVKFDKAGSRSTVVLNIHETMDTALALESPVMASDPLGYTSANGNVAVAIFDGSTPNLFMLRGENGVATSHFALEGTAAASGIAFGNLSGDATDLLAVTDTTLHLFPDYQALTGPDGALSCSVTSETRPNIFVGDVEGDSKAEVLLKIDAKIQVFDGASLLANAGTVVGCALLSPDEIVAPGDEGSFGTAVAVGDFDGNGQNDIAIAAPIENVVYIFTDWTAGSTNNVKLTAPTGSKRFGSHLTVGDFDGDGKDELVVADPTRDADGESGAGMVHIFGGDDVKLLSSLHDSNPEEGQAFGQAIAVDHAFGGDTLVVGATSEVFSYFRTPVPGDNDFR